MKYLSMFKKDKKRVMGLIALICMTALLVGMIGCGKKDAPSDTASAETSAETEAAEDSASEAATEAESGASDNQAIDSAVNDQAVSNGQAAEAEEPTSASNSQAEEIAPLSFEGILLDGSIYSSEELKDAKVVMINLFAAWCGPCLYEMPELEKLYEDYKDRGFVLLGVYIKGYRDDEIPDIVEELGITYPVMMADANLEALNTEYYPCSYFIDGDGNYLRDHPVIGAFPYEDWETRILEYLGE